MLLPAGLLLRRGFTVEVIGRVLELAALAVSARRIARTAGVARSTVRGWLARFTGRVELLRAHFTAWLLWHAPSTSQIPPTGGPVGDVVAVVAAAGAVAVEVLSAESVWAFASAATGGRLLANTSPPFPAPWPRSRCCWRCQLLAQQSPPEDEAACEHVHVAADAFDRDDHARMMDSMRRAHESAGSQHLHWRSKMVLKVFNATGEIYDYSPRSSTQLQQRRSASFP